MNKKVSLTYLLVFSLLFFISLLGLNKLQNKPSRENSSKIVAGCTVDNLSGKIDYSDTVAFFEGKKIEIPKYAFQNNTDQAVLGLANEERWIEIDLSEQKLKAWEGNSMFMQTPISTGLPWWPTPTGEYRVWIKLRATKMEGGEGKYYYNLPNVPHVMYFENDQIPGWRGFGIHGAYWHNEFGTPRSHGCVNLPLDQAEKLYYWASPILPTGKSSTRASSSNLGTRIVIHE